MFVCIHELITAKQYYNRGTLIIVKPNHFTVIHSILSSFMVILFPIFIQLCQHESFKRKASSYKQSIETSRFILCAEVWLTHTKAGK